MEKTILEVGERQYILSHQPFNAEIDMDDLTMIHYDNLIGEIITIPTLMNRVGQLKAEVDNAVRENNLQHRVLEAKKGEFYRNKLITNSGEKIKFPTVSQVEDAVVMDEEVISSKIQCYKVTKQSEVVDSLYWAVKSKEMKLNKISEGITPSDFEKELLEGHINGILIKKKEKSF